MPKQVYKILSFHGGINDSSDPRDIEDNQFVTLENVSIDKLGRITVLGDMNAAKSGLTPAGAITGAGTGLFAITTDYDGFLDNTVAAPGQTYYLVEDGSGIIGIGEDGEAGGVDFTSGDTAGIGHYYTGGALRLTDASHANTEPKWRGYVPAYTYGATTNAGYVKSTGTFETEVAEIKGCFPEQELADGTFACKNAIMVQTWSDSSYSDPSNNSYQLGSAGYSFNNCLTDTGANNGSAAVSAQSGMFWGLALEYGEDTAASANGTGTWNPANTVNYKFYVTTMYDEGKQESLPQLFTHFPHTDDSFYGASSDTGGAIGDYGRSFMTFMTGGKSVTPGLDVAVYMTPVLKINPGSDSTKFNFGSANAGIQTDTGNKRISGLKIYWASSEDGYTDLWQLMDLDLAKGVAPLGLTGGSAGLAYAPWVSTDHINEGYENGPTTDNYYIKADLGTVADSSKWTDPPKFITYEVSNGHPQTDVIKVDSWKTAVIANRRAYLGNVQQDGKVNTDRMLKSSAGQYDKFPSSVSNIDVVTHDGDSIVSLMEYADRIFQFKKNTVYVINVAGNSEFLEAEFKHKGITNPGAACKTDFGIAWVNNYGCYMYDGENVQNLLINKGVQTIDAATWSTFIGTGNFHRIGYEPSRQQLIVKTGLFPYPSGQAAYVFSLITKGWTKATAMVTDPNSNSNFINDPADGGLMVFDDGNNTVDKWSNTPAVTDAPILIKTKDFDFGEPSIRKKIYKVYVTYQGHGGKITINYGTNGGTCNGTFFITDATGVSTGANAANACLVNADTGEDDWVKAELKPSSSINNINSFQLLFDGLTTDADFAINDISIVYRTKNIK